MRATLATAMLAIMLPAAATSAPVDACASVKETLKWTAGALLTVRDGKSSGDDAGYVADAAEYAVDRMQAAGGWSDNAIAATERAFELARSAGKSGFDADGAAELLALADIIAAEAATLCAPGTVPVFVRPGVGDARACGQVIKALEAVARVLPTIAGKPGAPPPMLIYIASKEARKARGQASASQWSAASLAALDALAAEADALNGAPDRFGEDAAAAFAGLAGPVAEETRTICGSEEIPVISG